MRAERENSKTPLGVAISIENDGQRIAARFPANPDSSGLAGNRAIVSRRRSFYRHGHPSGVWKPVVRSRSRAVSDPATGYRNGSIKASGLSLMGPEVDEWSPRAFLKKWVYRGG